MVLRLASLVLILSACSPSRETCVPSCGEAVCGDDGCGDVCGTCAGDEACGDGACVKLSAICSNRQLDPGETDLDCGGFCGPCASGKACVRAEDCQSFECGRGRCVACANGRKDGDESDVDCGGACGPCGAGRTCSVAADCGGAACTEGRCGAPASCADGQKSAGETDVDCGGPACAACAVTKFCQEHRDCLSATCVFGVCERPTCADGVRNQGESDVDCAGPCNACADAKACTVDRDCASARCFGTRCVSCSNGSKDGDETGVDCGGTCAGCRDGLTCAADRDCASGRCTSGSCTSCRDRVLNGDETDVDCGGSCSDCAEGFLCRADGDCTGRLCAQGRCCTRNACGTCGPAPRETCNGADDDCDGASDEPSELGPAPLCEKQVGVCAGARRRCAGSAGWICGDDTYTAASARFEPIERTCDGYDNDCDGETDEGLKNACGSCGAPPVEVCNHADDDCDGAIDEDAGCDLCSATPSETLVDTSVGVSAPWAWVSGAMALDGNTAYLLTGGAYEVPSRVRRLVAGELPVTIGPNLPNGGTIAFGHGELHVVGSILPDFSSYAPRYHHFAPTATTSTGTDIFASYQTGQAHETRIAVNGTHVAATYRAYESWNMTWGTWAARLGPQGWVDHEQLSTTGETAYVAVAPNGDVWTAFSKSPGTTTRLLGRDTDNISNDFPLRIRIDPAGAPVLVSALYSGTFGVRRRSSSGTTWGNLEFIATRATAADVAWGPDGTMWAAWVPEQTSPWTVKLAKRSGNGTWTVATTWTPTHSNEDFKGLQLAVDAAGRLHLAATTSLEGANGLTYYPLVHALVCP